MKQLILLAILLGLVSCQPKNNEVTIKGKFIGDIPENLPYTVPVNGICYGWFSDTVKVDSTGNFEIKVQTDEPCFIKFFQYHFTGRLIVEPGKTYQVTIHASDNQYQITYDGYRSGLQEVYQSLHHFTPPQIDAMEFVRLPVSQATNQLNFMHQSEGPILEKVFHEEKISPELVQLIKLDRTLYYATIKSYVAQFKYIFGYQKKELQTLPDSLEKTWGNALQEVPLDSANLLKSAWAYYFLENYADFKEFSEKGFTLKVNNGLTEKGIRNTHKINVAKKYLTGNNLAFFNAAYLLTAVHQKAYEKELISLFNDFTTEYPDSRYTSYIEPYIKEITDFHQTAKQDFSNQSKFLDNYHNIGTLKACLAPLKGKKVYIDLWATWCGACKDEFAHKAKLDKLLRSKNVNILYISLDKEKDSTQWENMIKYYHLAGYHMRASNELKADLYSRFGNYGIPRYLLVDEKGNIVIDKAKHPSRLEELEKQIDEM